jgi:hypothetical protein
MKTSKIIFWTSTLIIFIMEGVIPGFTSQTEMAKQGISHLGYPEYFGTALAIFKVAGALTLVIPQMPKCVKEWAYAGFAFDFIFAGISLWAVDGITPMLLLPVTFLGILVISYQHYHKLNNSSCC